LKYKIEIEKIPKIIYKMVWLYLVEKLCLHEKMICFGEKALQR